MPSAWQGLPAPRMRRAFAAGRVHWGGNWGHGILACQCALARALIDAAGADLVQGLSSHHPQAAGVYRGRLILYRRGDLINTYEAIAG